MNEIAIQRTIVDMVEEYAAKDAALTGEVEAFAAAVRRAQFATTVGGVYGGDIWGRASGAIPRGPDKGPDKPDTAPVRTPNRA